MLSLLRRMLGARERPPQNPNVVIAPSYGVVSHKKLMEATELGLREAIGFAQKFPHAVIAFAACAHCYPGSEYDEARLKGDVLAQEHFSLERAILARGSVRNSVEELRNIKATLDARGVRPKEILFVAERLHARSVLYIARHLFPGTTLSLSLLDTTACQSDAPFVIQRNEWFFLLINVLREAALRTMGLEWVSKKTHQHS